MIYGITAFAGFEAVAALGEEAIRVLFAMRREQALPASLARLSSRQTPAVSIGCVAVLALALGLPMTYSDGGARTFGYLAGAGGLSIVLIYLAVNIARPSASHSRVQLRWCRRWVLSKTRHHR